MATGSDLAERPNVIVLVADDQRADTIAALGNRRIHTPNFDALVRNGTTFTNAFVANPICVQSRAEMLTGYSGFSTGLLHDNRASLAGRFPAWATQFAQAGYQTCYVGKWHTRGKPQEFGYSECRALYAGGGGRYWVPARDAHGREITGYAGWVFQSSNGELYPELGVGLTPNISEVFADAAVEFLEESDRPFFLHVNFTAPHDPLLVPRGLNARYQASGMQVPVNFLPNHPFDHGNLFGRDERLVPWPRTPQLVKEDLAVYYSVVTHLDAQVGKILRALEKNDLANKTLLIYTSDHGLAMGSHGLRGKQNMYDHTLRVPMLIRGPGVPAGATREDLVYLRDLYPTTCSLAGIDYAPEMDAQSFATLLEQQSAAIHQEVFAYFRDSQRAIRTQDYKYIEYPRAGRKQLFDLRADPSEVNNVAGKDEYSEIEGDLRRRLFGWRRQVQDPTLPQPIER